MSRYEQPDYEIVARRAEYEVRRYESYLVAETTVPGSFEETGNPAFRRLAGFIFGNNSAGVKMNMTVPVTREALGDDSYRYRFFLERAYTADSVPAPRDPRVVVSRVPGGHVAALGYRGNRDERRYRRAEARLLAALARDSLVATGSGIAAVYSGPLTPPPLRRNEVLVPVDWQIGQGV